MKYSVKNILVFSLLFMIIAVPVFVGAVNEPPIIPNCGITQPGGGVNRECGYYDLLTLVNNIINWIIVVSIPVAAGVFAWAGFKFMTTGIVDERSAAKKMIWSVFKGLVFILAAWIIVGTIIKALLKDPSIVPVQININKSINFYA